MAIIDLRITKEEFLDLTPYEYSLLVHYNSRSLKNDFSILRNTIYNAGANLMRSKGDKEIPLFDDTGDKNMSEEEIREERETLFKEAP